MTPPGPNAATVKPCSRRALRQPSQFSGSRPSMRSMMWPVGTCWYLAVTEPRRSRHIWGISGRRRSTRRASSRPDSEEGQTLQSPARRMQGCGEGDQDSCLRKPAGHRRYFSNSVICAIRRPQVHAAGVGPMTYGGPTPPVRARELVCRRGATGAAPAFLGCLPPADLMAS